MQRSWESGMHWRLQYTSVSLSILGVLLDLVSRLAALLIPHHHVEVARLCLDRLGCIHLWPTAADCSEDGNLGS